MQNGGNRGWSKVEQGRAGWRRETNKRRTRLRWWGHHHRAEERSSGATANLKCKRQMNVDESTGSRKQPPGVILKEEEEEEEEEEEGQSVKLKWRPSGRVVRPIDRHIPVALTSSVFARKRRAQHAPATFKRNQICLIKHYGRIKRKKEEAGP